jgi:hypothetical protein
VSTLTEIEKAIEALPPDQWWEIRRWMEDHPPKSGRPVTHGSPSGIPQVPATGHPITQDQIDDALDAD